MTFYWDGRDSYISIADDGDGMSPDVLTAAMRPGDKSPLDERGPRDLGRFGLGLKTASFSQCRELTAVSRVRGGARPYGAGIWTTSGRLASGDCSPRPLRARAV